MRHPFGPVVLAAAALMPVVVPVSGVRGDCPTNHTFRVEYSYDIDGEAFPQLWLTVGYTYTFELYNPNIHPFMLTTSSVGGPGASALPVSAGVSCLCQGCGTCTRRSITFTPVASLVGTAVYYQCATHQWMGNSIHILPAPAVTLNAEPQPANRCVGEEASFVVSATSNEGGAEVLSYQWRRDGEPLVDAPGRVSGAGTSHLVITGVTTDDQGAITCVVSGPCKSATTTPAQLMVTSCCPADIGVAGGLPGSDGQLDNNDFIAFIDSFFQGDSRADVGMAGGLSGSDGEFDNNDFIAFINRFFAGC